MVATFALLILPGTYHRLVEKGNASGRSHALTNKLAVTALIPFTVSLGIDVGIIGERILGLVGGITAGLLVGALALFFLLRPRKLADAIDWTSGASHERADHVPTVM